MDKMHFDPKDPCILTYTGRTFHYLRFGPDDICIEDIAHALSNICRYTGHCKQFYSVAEHSLMCSDMGRSWELQTWGLLHDASEAYIGDINSPLKRTLWTIPCGAAYNDLQPLRMREKSIQRAIVEKFDLPWPIPEAIDKIDKYVLEVEMGFLFDGQPMSTMTPPQAEEAFLNRFQVLQKMRPEPEKRHKDLESEG